ncbi:hypothetical protein [Pseudomonas maumuensis]|uniref:Uncharacterized protein n=1 Tax=Pseudomonas maumuensis TaxID=2842354 RepID=A0ABX8NQR6_9PSED|nr:hypothetical protein [Pseudomonas maumuensis]QXH58394.1 hypothetical protein KSS90_09415 [Pseudomonas maumuensis]
MSEYVYSPRDSFLARCWWQTSGRRIEVDTWDDIKGMLGAIWVQTGSRNARGHRERYLQCEADGVWRKYIDPSSYVSPEHRYYENFWFGAYTRGRYSQCKQRYYEIRPADRVGSIGNWTLDFNTLYRSGYVGLWATKHPAGNDRLPAGARLWTVDYLPRQGPAQGLRRYNLRLLNAEGAQVRRLIHEGDRLFNVIHGDSGLITLEILSIPHHFGEI